MYLRANLKYFVEDFWQSFKMKGTRKAAGIGRKRIQELVGI